MQPEQPTLTLRDYLVPVWRRRRMILALVVVITAVVTAYYATRPVTYTASTEVYVGPQADPALGIAPSEPTFQAIANQATLLTSTETAAVVAKAIGYTGSPAGLAASVTATPSQTTNFISITAHSSSSVQAIRIANAFAHQFISQNTTSQVAADDKQLAVLRKQEHSLPASDTAGRQSIQSQIQQLQVAASTSVGNASQINVATRAAAARKSTVEFGVLAAIGALIGGILLAFLLERLDPRLKGIQHTEMVYEHPVLATVWHDDGIDHFVDEKPALSPRSREAFRDLRIGLYLAGGEDAKVIVVSSAVPNEGKSTVARNLALALSEGGRRVVLVDADMRKASLPRTLGLKPRSGLAELLAGARTLDEVVVEVSIDVPEAKESSQSRSDGESDGLRNGETDFEHNIRQAARIRWSGQGAEATVGHDSEFATLRPGFASQPSLFFLHSGTKPPNPQGVLESQGFRLLVQELKRSFDAVVIDSTPLTLVSDAIPVVQCVDAVLLVARSSTDARSARHASEIIKRVPGANVIGLVVNDVPEAAAAAYGKGYGYGYYGYGYGSRYGGYGYGYIDEEPETEAAKPTESSG